MPSSQLRAATIAAALGLCLTAAWMPASAQENCRNCGRPTSGAGACNGVNCLPPEGHYPDLFYNFYASPNCGRVPAEMYPAPFPTPPIVGHVYYTYQPLLPHEMLYPHKRTYHQYYNYGRGLNRTTVRWW